MSQEEAQTQSVAQAGLSSEAAGVGPAVGVLRSSVEAPVMGVERRRDACSGVRGGRRPKAPQGDKPLRRKVTNPVCRCAGKRRTGTELGKPDTEIRSSGLMRGEVATQN